MNFQVTFNSKNGLVPVLKDGREAGLAIVGLIRDETGAKIPLDRINGNILRIVSRPNIEIAEEKAIIINAANGAFQDGNSIIAMVPSRFFNDCVEIKIFFSQSEETLEVTSAEARFVLNEDKVMQKWAKCNYAMEIEEKND